MNYTVSVKALCSFTAKRGDLDTRFTPAPSAMEGIQGHRIVATRRGGGYQTEVSLQSEQGMLMVRGRADGYDPRVPRIDECKTYRGDFERLPKNRLTLHWAQVQTYGAQLCRREGLAEVELALVYFDIDEQTEQVLTERFCAPQLEALFVERCGRFAQWANNELQRRTDRNVSLAQLVFPYEFHGGQRQLANAVYRAAAHAECLLAQAPTGVGKTLGTMFPMLKAMGEGKVDKVFYLTAKGTGRGLAMDGVRQLQRGGAAVRALDLVAREKACVYPGRECHGESCPLARGFYDRLDGARKAASACQVLDQAAVREIALCHQICPYYLSQEMVRWCDVVVADYNHYFDHGGLLHAMTLEEDWKVGLLIDEAHNLIERGRDMYSSDLSLAACRAALAVAPKALRQVLGTVERGLISSIDRQEVLYAAYDEVPKDLVRGLKNAVAAVGEYAVHRPDALAHGLQEFYFEAVRFCRLAEGFAEHSLFDLQRDASGEEASLGIQSVIPGSYLQRKFNDAHCSILFSATLSPAIFYRDVLGLSKDTVFLDAPSPFRSDQLEVQVASHISTRYRQRTATLTAIVELVETQYRRAPGKYLFFASSFEYLAQVWALFTLRNRHVRCWSQQRIMTEVARAQFISEFDAPEPGIGFAVLGGAFAEGIDLVGDRLIGAFIATLGMPQANSLNNAMAERMELAFGEGFNYVYLYPGIRKVVQAAGRVIRSTSDTGSVHLIDARYSEEEIVALLPSWWSVTVDTIESSGSGERH